MKKILKKFLVLAVAVFLSVLFIAPAMIHADVAVVSIIVTPNPGTINALGQSIQYTATATYSDNSTADVTSTATWAINDPSIASNDGAGKFTAIKEGWTYITATLNGVTGAANLNVVVPTMNVWPGKAGQSTDFYLWASGCKGLTWSLVVNNGTEDIITLSGKILDDNWNNSYYYNLPAGTYTATFSVGGTEQQKKTFSVRDFASSIDVSVGYAGETTTFTLNATNSSGKTAQFEIWDIVNSKTIYSQGSISIGNDDWSYTITQTLAAGHYRADFWVEGVWAGGNEFYVVNQSVPQPAPPVPQPAPPRPLTPDEQVALNLSIEQQASLYGKDNIGFIKTLYDNILGRAAEADSEGLNNWVTALNNGITPSSVVYNFVFSKELENKISAATPEEFVTFLYKNVLDRDPDPDGYAGWVSAMNRGMSKEDVLLNFTSSDEFKNICKMFGLTQ